MKNILLTIPMAALLFACTSKSSNSGSNGNRTEITPFIVSKVILKDTLMLNRIFLKDTGYKGTFAEPGPSYDNNPAMYLEQKEFDGFQAYLWSMVSDPRSKIFLGLNGGSPDWNKPASRQQLRDVLLVCDSLLVSTFDAKGNEVLTASFACDSTTKMEGICAITFYESWYFNNESRMIEKEILGYNVFQYVAEKQAFRQLFYVFRDEEALKKAKENYSEL